MPLADAFNHKASLVLLQDGWEVAESAHQQKRGGARHGTDGCSSEEDDIDEDSGSASSDNGSGGDDDDNSSSGGGSSSGKEDSSSSDADDPHHGFAVGGMTLPHVDCSAESMLQDAGAGAGSCLYACHDV